MSVIMWEYSVLYWISLHAHEPKNKQTRIEYCEKEMHFMQLNKICKSCAENQQKYMKFCFKQKKL